MLHLPETAHLYVLLNCAQFNQDKYLEPELESYLIQTLLRYSEMSVEEDYSDLTDVADLDIADGQDQDLYLKEIADYCLICTGLMSDRFVFEEISYQRLQEVGQHAFAMLSDHEENDDNIYLKLSKNFSSLVDVLQCSQTLIMNDHQKAVSDSSTITHLLNNTDPMIYECYKPLLSNGTKVLYH